MPFINVRVAGPKLHKEQVAALQQGITSLMSDVLRKQAELTAVLIEEVQVGSWAIGGRVVENSAQVDAIVSAGTNTPEEKSQFVASTYKLLQEVLGTDFSKVCYIVVHDVPKDSWGYNGETQAYRSQKK